MATITVIALLLSLQAHTHTHWPSVVSQASTKAGRVDGLSSSSLALSSAFFLIIELITSGLICDCLCSGGGGGVFHHLSSEWLSIARDKTMLNCVVVVVMVVHGGEGSERFFSYVLFCSLLSSSVMAASAQCTVSSLP